MARDPDWALKIEVAAPGETARVEYRRRGNTRVWTKRVPVRTLGSALANLDSEAGPAVPPDEWTVMFDGLGTEASRLALLVHGDGRRRALWVDASPRRTLDLVRVGVPTRAYYHDDRQELVRMANVVLPPLLWDCMFTPAGRLQQSRLWITEVPVTHLRQQVRVHHWPWGNVYSDAHICWGYSGDPAVVWGHPKAVDDAFFGAPFNTDLAIVTLASLWTTRIGYIPGAHPLSPAAVATIPWELRWTNWNHMTLPSALATGDAGVIRF